MPNAVITAATIAKAKSDSKPGGGRFDIVDAKSTGLSLRVSPSGVQWSLRFQVNSKDKRLALGSVDLWSITEARSLAAKAQDMLRDRMGIPDEQWLDRIRRREGKLTAVTLTETALAVNPRAAFKWTFAEGRRAYLVDVQRTLSKGTYTDYAQKLGLRELAVLEKEALPSISRQRVADLIAAIHRSGREATAEGVARVISAMWSWLSADAQLGRSGVAQGVMRGLRPPDRTRKTGKRMVADPTLEDIGRIVSIARSGAIDPLIGCAVELVVWSVQRRRAVVSAKVEDFRALDGSDEGLWYVFADDRKRSHGDAHVVPLPAPAWSCVQRAMAILNDDYNRRLDDDSNAQKPEYLFPQARPRRKGMVVSHMHESTLTHCLGFMPGVQSSPHDLRRIFGTYGERVLGFSRLTTKLILDHSEGGMRSDITGRHYSLHDGTHEKWPVMRRWCDAVVRDTFEAVQSLEPVNVLREALREARQRPRITSGSPLGDEGVGPIGQVHR